MADNLSAVVRDGELQAQTASQVSLSGKKNAGMGSNLDKDAFLQLLVAQMKYQDPLEPTENTEYVSQLATFSSLEEMQNMSAGMTLQRASSLVGETVIIKAIDSATGGTEYAQGKVDYVVYENNKAFVSIEDQLYSIDDVYQVSDARYQAAYDTAVAFMDSFQSLPPVDRLEIGDKNKVNRLKELFNNMDEYGQSFLPTDTRDKLSEYVSKMADLEVLAKAQAEAEEKTEGKAEEKTEG